MLGNRHDLRTNRASGGERMKRLMTLLATILIVAAVLFWASCAAEESRKNLTSPQLNDSYYEKGILYIGFSKGVSQAIAEEILKNLNLKYKRTININAGRKFFYKTGEKFLIRVPDGEELMWLEKLNKIPEIEATGQHIDPRKALID